MRSPDVQKFLHVSICLSRERSATNRLRCVFSFSSCLRRCSSATPIPAGSPAPSVEQDRYGPYWLTPISRQASAGGLAGLDLGQGVANLFVGKNASFSWFPLLLWRPQASETLTHPACSISGSRSLLRPETHFWRTLRSGSAIRVIQRSSQSRSVVGGRKERIGDGLSGKLLSTM